MEPTAFEKHCLNGVREFLQTALVIDNELFLEDAAPPDAPKTKYQARQLRPGGSVLAGTALVDVASGGTPPAEAVDAVPERTTTTEQSGKARVSPLDARAIMNAFLRNSMICGLHKPKEGGELVTDAIQAGRRSDVVIIDWYLAANSSDAAKKIIVGLLQSDTDQHGRLRLIAVYTSEPDLAGLAGDLFQTVQTENDKAYGLRVLDGPVLAGRDTRVVFLNKPESKGVAQAVAPDELPDRMVLEFSKITGGLLTTFAVRAIAEVRRSTHHILSIFHSALDSAYLGHRCALKSPEDAREFAVELVSGEIHNVVSMMERSAGMLGVGVIDAWIGEREADGHRFTNGAAHVTAEWARDFVRRGEEGIEDSLEKKEQTRDNGKPLGNEPRIRPEGVGAIFHVGEQFETTSLRFCRLSSFKREAFGRTSFPADWVPMLTLGSVLLKMTADRQAPEGEGIFLVCIQPRCDSVRLDGEVGFPFQVGHPADKKFNLVVMVPGANGEPTEKRVAVGYKPRDTHMLSFQPRDPAKEIRAERHEDGRFYFVPVDGSNWLWLGDLRDLKAQRDASAVAARMHQVGIDEYEWLRRRSP